MYPDPQAVVWELSDDDGVTLWLDTDLESVDVRISGLYTGGTLDDGDLNTNDPDADDRVALRFAGLYERLPESDTPQQVGDTVSTACEESYTSSGSTPPATPYAEHRLGNGMGIEVIACDDLASTAGRAPLSRELTLHDPQTGAELQRYELNTR